jgi:formate hydrogenlyase subunit 3/multisubunit Na+/H+ antiporter MnhD subunit
VRHSPTPDGRKVDPNTPDGARRIAIAWTGFVGVGLFALALVWGGWTVAQARGYTDNFRGFEEGDPFPWIFVLLSAAFSVFALFRAIGKWARYTKVRRQSQ